MRRRISRGDSQATLHHLALLYSLCLACSQLTLGFGVNQTMKPRVPAVILFGDSIFDSGNNNNLNTLQKCNFPPYGKDFVDHIPTGRFSNGKIPGDLIASSLGVKELVPAYLSPELGDEELLSGVSFASGSTGYDPITSTVASVISMEDQLQLFGEYKEKLRVIAGKARADSIISQSLFVVCAGSNDLINTYFPTPFRKLHYDLPSYHLMSTSSSLKLPISCSELKICEFTYNTPGFSLCRTVDRRDVRCVIDKFASFEFAKLYKMGARRIGFIALPPLGCLPSQITIAGDATRECVEALNQAALLYNSKISSEIKSLAANFSDAKLAYFDIYQILFDIIQRPSAYVFDVSDKGCCGTGQFEATILCNNISPLCADDSKYVFWDAFHPTEKAYKALVVHLFQNYINNLI